MAAKSGFRFSQRSLDNLATVKPELQRVITRALALSEVDFAVIEGKRSVERQRQLLAAGATRTLKSKHITGDAVDLAAVINGQIRWDWPLYARIAVAVKRAAADLDTKIVWGGDWRKFKDGPHFELHA